MVGRALVLSRLHTIGKMGQLAARCMGNQLCRNMSRWLTQNPDCVLGVIQTFASYGMSGAPNVTTLTGATTAGTDAASVGIDCFDKIPGTRRLVVEKQLGAVDDVAPKSFWRKTQRGDKTVYQRDDLIDPCRVNLDGTTNLQQMQLGNAPYGSDGQRINLHHMLQTDEGPLAEMTQTFHQNNKDAIHINPSSMPTGIDRGSFRNWKRQYWKQRARDFGGC
jgi:HNH/ENDO VII superfamily nuclease